MEEGVVWGDRRHEGVMVDWRTRLVQEGKLEWREERVWRSRNRGEYCSQCGGYMRGGEVVLVGWWGKKRIKRVCGEGCKEDYVGNGARGRGCGGGGGMVREVVV